MHTRKFPDGAHLESEGCLMCGFEELDESAVVFRDDHWACEVVPGSEVPGWFLMRTRRHALGWQDLNAAELRTHGFRTQAMVQSACEVFAAPTAYLFQFGEKFAHFHFLIAARTDDVPLEYRFAQLHSLRDSRRDPVSAIARVPDMRAAFARIAAQQ